MTKRKCPCGIEPHRVLNDKGEVAVVISPGYGSGFYVGLPDKIYRLCPVLVNRILDGKSEELNIKFLEAHFKASVTGEVSISLEIEWVPQGSKVEIREYDGSESVVYYDEDDWICT